MKLILDQKTVNSLSLASIPVPGPDLKPAAFKPAPDGVRQVLIVDAHREAPLGFGVRVGKTGRGYYAEKKIRGKTIRFALGDARTISLEAARDLARKKIAETVEHGESPNKRRKASDAAQITLGQAWDRYIDALKSRPQVPKPHTMDNIEKARDRLKRERPDWEARKVKGIIGQEVIDLFNDIAKNHRTTAEQVGRWASAAIRHSIRMESHDAQVAGRPPALTYDPFSILGKSGMAMYRSRAQMEEDYKARGVRNPLSSETIGKFIEAAYAYRRINSRGGDFLLLTLLWGARKGESCKMAWRDRIDAAEAAKSSYVDMRDGFAHFHDPKSRISYDLPLAPCATEILRFRREETVGKWVFPARDVRAVEGYYKDPTWALAAVKEMAGIKDLRPHDLRRTAGRVAESLGWTDRAIRNLLGHTTTDTLGRYTDTEWATRLDRMTKLEAKILGFAPSVYNALRPAKLPPLGETAPTMINRDKMKRKSQAKRR